MGTIKVDLTNKYGKFKMLNATNGGPIYKRHATDQWRTNITEYKDARIPFSRNHDSNAIAAYGGPYAHDISAIFPNFAADENDAGNYDFDCTDESILCTLEAGTKTFFRLGQTIEHQIKKHNTLPPKDFEKWARICEHVIRHYTEGWAHGYTLDMPYWEIWNEPDLDDDDSPNKRTWGGTKAEFFDFYETVAKYLKSKFPHLKIVGPELAYREDWAKEFLCEMQKRNVPIDFFSWHIYSTDPGIVTKKADTLRAYLDRYGYEKTESILNEWNYVRGWTNDFVYSIETIHGMKGAAYVASVMSLAQISTSIDMLMYYDTRPSVFNGVFDFYTYRPLKSYWCFKWYGELYGLAHEVRATELPKDVYLLCGVDEDGKVTAIITHYSERDDKENAQVTLDFGKDGEFDVFLLDNDHDGEFIKTTTELSFDMAVNTCIKIKERA